jgi:hypothetical protein
MSQNDTDAPPLPLNLRPDRCGVIFDTLAKHSETIVARLRPHDINKLDRPEVQRFIKTILRSFRYIIVTYGSHRQVLTKEPSDLLEEFHSSEEDGKHKMTPRLVKL